MQLNEKLILASASPRRQELMHAAGFEFEVIVKPIDETIPPGFKKERAAKYIAEKKAEAFEEEVNAGMTVITSDTIVCVDDLILGKPESYESAVEMLRLLSGRSHEVITAVCIRKHHLTFSFHETTTVTFRVLAGSEIDYYVTQYKPFDKAGAYGIQEWIGLVGVTSIQGSFYNVVGLPVDKVYMHLKKIIS